MEYNIMTNYCTQNNGDCSTCFLANYGRDCHNNPIVTVTSDVPLRIHADTGRVQLYSRLCVNCEYGIDCIRKEHAAGVCLLATSPHISDESRQELLYSASVDNAR